MKSTTLNPADRSVVNRLCDLLMEMNKRDDHHAGHSCDLSRCQTYGFLYEAVIYFVKQQTDVDIRGSRDWNLGGNNNYADDIQAAINEIVKDFEAEQRYLAEQEREQMAAMERAASRQSGADFE